jgi:hypothetical protein
MRDSPHFELVWGLVLIFLFGAPVNCHGSSVGQKLQANVAVCVFVLYATFLFYFRLNFYRSSKAWNENKSIGTILATLFRLDTVLLYFCVVTLQQLAFWFSAVLIFPMFLWSKDFPTYEKWGFESDWFIFELLQRLRHPNKIEPQSQLPI